MWTDSGYTFLWLLVLVTLPAWYLLQNRAKRGPPYPPGPRGHPLIGNLLDFPSRVPLWEGLTSLAKQYGRVTLSRRPAGLERRSLIFRGCRN